VFALGDVMSQ